MDHKDRFGDVLIAFSKEAILRVEGVTSRKEEFLAFEKRTNNK